MQMFWLNTLIPIYVEFASALDTGLVPFYKNVDYVEFDTKDVQALQEDQNAKHLRVRDDFKAGIIARKQARDILGYAEPDDDDSFLIPMSMVVEPVKLAPEVNPTVSGIPRIGTGEKPQDQAADGKPGEAVQTRAAAPAKNGAAKA
jgi:hypothetical protein